MKRIALFGLILAVSAFAADAPKPSSTIAALMNIEGQIRVMIAEVEDAKEWEQSSLDNLTTVEADIGAVQKTVNALAERVKRLQSDQIGRVTSLAVKASMLKEEVTRIEELIKRMEVAP